MIGHFLVFISFGLIALIYLMGERNSNNVLKSLALTLFTAYAIVWILFIFYLWFNHITFPLNLEAMELTIVQHLKEVMSGQPIYVPPSSNFVPLAYTPLFYYFSIPFAWIFGVNLFTMRLVAILGMLGSLIIIFLVAKNQTRSLWWGIIAVGLFAAAYRVMDTYLDNAHSDSWLLCSVLLGCYLIQLNRSRTTNALGVIFLIISFWFKQHGALFAIGGVLYLTWRDGIKASWIYWALAILLGPVSYVLAPAWLLGPQFHYYTLTVPSHWSELNFSTIKRYLGFIIKNYFILTGVGIPAAIYFLFQKWNKVSIWFFMLPFAMLSGFMGALDPGSNNNVFIMMGVWFILAGILGIHTLWEQHSFVNKWAIHLLGLGISFSLFFFNPTSVIVSPKAPQAYQDLIGYLNSLDGTVYAPWLGQLENGYVFSPAVHWVPMEDLIRGPGVNEYDNPETRILLDSVIHPKAPAYILMNYPLENDILLSFLSRDYQLETDLGDRFSALSTLPKRFNLAYPRYLYKYSP